MLTVEVRINGTLLGHVTAVNMGTIPGGTSISDRCLYRLTFHNLMDHKVKEGTLVHDRVEGAARLAAQVMAWAADT